MLRHYRLHSRCRPRRRRNCLVCRGWPLAAVACSSWLMGAALMVPLAAGLARRVIPTERGLMLRLNLGLGRCLSGDTQVRTGHGHRPRPQLPVRHSCPVHVLHICCCIRQEGPIVQVGWNRGSLLVRSAHSCRCFLRRLHLLLRHWVFLDGWRVDLAALHLVGPSLQRLGAASSTGPD